MVSLVAHSHRCLAQVLPLLSLVIGLLSPDQSTASDAQTVFARRILPIFRSPDPSSCIQCHLSSVDLKDYILPSAEATFASLRAQGLVDTQNPSRSKILELIQMGEKDSDPGARMIHEKNRQAEYEAFAAWIETCTRDPRLMEVSAGTGHPAARPAVPDPVIRHARKSRVLDSFTRNVWAHRMRCFPCHTPHEMDDDNPQHQLARKRLQEMEKNLGIRFTSKLALFRETPEATLQRWVDLSRSEESKDRLPLLHLKEPENSLILLKPMAKLPPKNEDGSFAKPSAVPPVSHQGGLKMHKDDFAYKSIISWIRDYASVVAGDYRNVEDLPMDNWHPAAEQMLLIRNLPEDWEHNTRVQLFIHPWNAQTGDWSTEPLAFTQGLVTPKHTAFGAIYLMRSPASEKLVSWGDPELTLPAGRYLLKLCRDRENQLDLNPALLLGQQDLEGETVLQAAWGRTFKNAEKIDGSLFRSRTAKNR